MISRIGVLVLGLMLGAAMPARAQPVPSPSAADPALESDPAEALSRYLRLLAANPRDLSSLTGAGRAALILGDASAALGFYARAEEIAPKNGRVKAGLAAALVQMEQPRAALKLFDDALELGVPEADLAGDRGLAHDLRGDNRRAQTDYAIALRNGNDPETLRRLALSLAISGDRARALSTLDPLVRQRDKAAWRVRAFVLALTGDTMGASTAVATAMPGPQAAAMMPFFAKLDGLKPAQKAAAVHFGHFPSDGRRYSEAELFADAADAANDLPKPAPAGPRSDSPLIPAGKPLGTGTALLADATPGRLEPVSRAPRRRPGQTELAATPRAAAVKIASSTTQAPPAKAPPPARPPAPKLETVQVTPPPTATLSQPAPAPSRLADLSIPIAALAAAEPTPMLALPPPAPVPLAERIPVEPARPDLIGPPTRLAETQPAAAPPMLKTMPAPKPAPVPPPKKPEPRIAKPEAKDMKAAKDAKTAKDAKAAKDAKTAKDAKDAKAKLKPDPKITKKTAIAERYWVQVASGTNKGALGKVWAALKAKSPKLFGGRSAWTAPWRASNRLLVGPFKTEDEAQGFVNMMARAGQSGIQFTTRAGVDVERLPAS